MTANIISSVVSAIVVAIAIGAFSRVVKSFRTYVENTIAPREGQNLYQQIEEVRDLSGRAVVIATRAEASVKRTEEKLDVLLLVNDRTSPHLDS